MEYLLTGEVKDPPESPDPPSEPESPESPDEKPDSPCKGQTVSFELNLNTDSWGEETSWVIVDHSTEEVVKSGDGYSSDTEYNEAFCLDRNACYTWVIHDEALDG